MTRLSLSPTLGMEEEMSLCEHLGDEIRYKRDNENDSCQGIFLKYWKGYRDKLKNFLGRIFIFPFTGVLISLNPPFKSPTSHFLFPLKVSLFSPRHPIATLGVSNSFSSLPSSRSPADCHTCLPGLPFLPWHSSCSCSRSYLMSSLALLCKRLIGPAVCRCALLPTHTKGHQKPHHPKIALPKPSLACW